MNQDQVREIREYIGQYLEVAAWIKVVRKEGWEAGKIRRLDGIQCWAVTAWRWVLPPAAKYETEKGTI